MGAAHPMRDSTPGQRSARWGAVNLTGGRASDGEQYTRWGAVHPDRTGAMHTDRVSRPHQQAQPRHTVACRSTYVARRGTRRRRGWLDSLRCVRVRWLVGYRRGSLCYACDAAWGIGVGRGVCGCDGCAAARSPLAPGGLGAAYVTSSVVGHRCGSRCVRVRCRVGYRRGSRRCACVSRRPRPCRCRDGCRETRAPGGPGRWPLRR